jgi:hypothetical protein
LGHRLLQTFEVECMALGLRSIALGTHDGGRSFYERLGYHGRASMHKDLPLPGRVLDLRLRKLTAELGDLDAGAIVTTDRDGSKVPAIL